MRQLNGVLARKIAYGVLLLLSLATSASGQIQPVEPKDLTSLDLADLMKVEVTTASKQAQPLSDVAAAMSVITQDDILKSGARSIPDVLRMVPGLQVNQLTGNRWSISARGFGGEFSNLLLVMIDGRTVYTPLFNGVFWDLQDMVLADIDRIEVIRGPGGAMWGANAVNGIINIITKSARDTVGKYAEIGAGSHFVDDDNLEYGDLLGDGAFRVYAKYQKVSDLKDPGGGLNMDGYDSHRIGFRGDFGDPKKNNWLIEGAVANDQGTDLINVPVIDGDVYNTRLLQLLSNEAYVLARGTFPGSKSDATTLQVYYDFTNVQEPEAREIRGTFDIDLQRNQTFGPHSLVYGAGYRQSSDGTVGSSEVNLVPPSETVHLPSAFIQDQWQLDRLDRLTVGAKAERNDYTGWEFQPTVRFTRTPDRGTTLWASITRAVSTPSRQDESLTGDLAIGAGPGGYPVEYQAEGGNVESERLVAYEIGARREVNPRWWLDAAAYYNSYDRLLSFKLGTPSFQMDPYPHYVQPVIYSNGVVAQTAGFELSSKWRSTERLDVTAELSLFTEHARVLPGYVSDLESDRNDTPRTQAGFRIDYSLGRGLDLTSSLYYNDAVPLDGLSPEFKLDLVLNYKASKTTQFQLALTNLLTPAVNEAVGSDFNHTGEVPRAVYIGVSTKF